MADSSKEKITLLQTARFHWRSFWPVWAFPAWFLFGGLLAEKLNHPLLFFYFFALPTFYWSIHKAAGPWMRHLIKYTHFVFLAMIVPFITWIILVFAKIFVLAILGIKP